MPENITLHNVFVCLCRVDEVAINYDTVVVFHLFQLLLRKPEQGVVAKLIHTFLLSSENWLWIPVSLVTGGNSRLPFN